MSQQIKFSVVCPFYNSEKYLECAIDSVIHQTYNNWELVLVNDGSSDNSLNIANSKAESDNRIKIISIKNSGAFFARNVGIENSIGDYVTFLDSDDYFNEELLETIEKEIVTNNVDAIVYNLSVFGDKTIKYKAISSINKYATFYSNKDILRVMFVENNYGYGVCGCAFKRKVFSKVHVDVVNIPRYAEDMYLAYALFSALESVTLLPDNLYYYRMNSDSVTHNLTPKDYYDRFLVFQEIYNDIDFRFSELFCKPINTHIFWGFFNYITYSPKYDQYSTYKLRCNDICKNPFYVKYIKQYSYNGKKVTAVKFLVNHKLFYLSYILLKYEFRRIK